MRVQEMTDAIVARKDDNGAIAMLLMSIMHSAANVIDAETLNERRRLYEAIEEAVLMLLDFLPREVRAQLKVICKAQLQDLHKMNEPAWLIKQVVHSIEYQVNVLDRLAKSKEHKLVQALQLIREGLDKLLLCSQ